MKSQDQDFPSPAPADYHLGLLQDEMMLCMMQLGGILGRHDQAAEIGECLARVAKIEHTAAQIISEGLLPCTAANDNTRVLPDQAISE